MELLERFSRGDLEAFEALFRQFQGEVYGWMIRIVRNSAAAEDLTLEAFWRAYRGHARFDPARSFPAWIRRIATNVALDHLRRARPEDPLPDQLPDSGHGDPAANREMAAQIRAAFLKLPPRLRLVATLALVEERPYEEISAALHISVTAIKLRVFRAVRRLRQTLKRMGSNREGSQPRTMEEALARCRATCGPRRTRARPVATDAPPAGAASGRGSVAGLGAGRAAGGVVPAVSAGNPGAAVPPVKEGSPMTHHPYLRAYMAGIVVPTGFLLVRMTGFCLVRYVYNISEPVECVMVFPMAVVPNPWGAWNMLFLLLFVFFSEVIPALLDHL